MTTQQPDGIEVTGEGEHEARPDVARFRIGVQLRRPDVAAARQAAAEAQTRVLTALRGAGLGDDDLQTENLSVQPEYEYTQTGRNMLGYSATNMVVARVADLTRLPGAIDAAVGAGGDDVQLHGITFELSDPAAARAEARARAMQDARATAEQLAALAGVELGDVRAIVDQPQHDGPGPVMMRMQAEAADAASTPVEAGVTRVRARVSVRYAIR